MLGIWVGISGIAAGCGVLGDFVLVDSAGTEDHIEACAIFLFFEVASFSYNRFSFDFQGPSVVISLLHPGSLNRVTVTSAHLSAPFPSFTFAGSTP